MADLTSQTARVCASLLGWYTRVQGSRGDVYTVRWARQRAGLVEYDYSCTCPAFVHGASRPCKHIEAVRHQHCRWGEEAFCGDRTQAKPDTSCPRCGGPTQVIEVLV